MQKFILLVLILLVISGCDSNSDDLLKQISEKDKMIQELNDKVDSLSSTLNNYKIESKTDNDTLNNLNDEIDLLEEQNDELQLALDTSNQQIQELQLEITTLEEKETDESFIKQSSKLSVYEYNDGKIGMGQSYNTVGTYSNLLIIGYGTKEWEHKTLDLTSGHTATLTIEVTGTLYNFKIERILWDEDMTSYDVTEVICDYEKISDTDVLFNSVLSEGIPPELLSWKDNEGKEFYYLIGDNSLSGISYPYIIISELVELDPWWEKD